MSKKYKADEDRYEKMKYRRTGKSGLLLPELSLGLWHNFGFNDDFNNSRGLLKCAFDNGITHFDLANNYGPPYGAAETTFGKILKKDFKKYRDELMQYLNDNNKIALKDLYVRSSQTLFIIGGFIFLLIVLNINMLYNLIPETFSGGLLVVFMVGIAKLYDCLMGCNNVVLMNSNYYRVVLLFGVVLTVLTVLLNMLFIPIYGINGSAFATFLAISIYNTIKVYFVKVKYGMMPFTLDTGKACIIILLLFGIFYFWEFPWHPIVNIALKSLLILSIYVLLIYRLNLSEDINLLIRRYLKLK